MAAVSRSSYLRAGTWALHMVLPVLGLWLLIAQPGIDIRWENHRLHFAIVLAVAAITVALASGDRP